VWPLRKIKSNAFAAVDHGAYLGNAVPYPTLSCGPYRIALRASLIGTLDTLGGLGAEDDVPEPAQREGKIDGTDRSHRENLRPHD
jgi:hypothetical protein